VIPYKKYSFRLAINYGDTSLLTLEKRRLKNTPLDALFLSKITLNRLIFLVINDNSSLQEIPTLEQ